MSESTRITILSFIQTDKSYDAISISLLTIYSGTAVEGIAETLTLLLKSIKPPLYRLFLLLNVVLDSCCRTILLSNFQINKKYKNTKANFLITRRYLMMIRGNNKQRLGMNSYHIISIHTINITFSFSEYNKLLRFYFSIINK